MLILEIYHLALRLRVPESAIRQMIAADTIPYTTLPTGQIRFLEPAINRWLQDRQHNPEGNDHANL